MKRTFTAICLLSSLAFISAIMKEDGRAGATGSPGETTCNTTQCHVGNIVNNGLGSISIAAPTMTNWEYVPGQVYPISVTVAKSGAPLFGLGFEALRSTGANGGTLSITNSVETWIKSAFVSPNVRTNVVHKQNGGLTANSHTFNFNWTAPVTGVGTVTFYAAGNAANNNGAATGDFIYTTTQIVTESTSGIASIENLKSVRIFPNPAINDFQVDYELTKPAMVSISILDLSGKLVTELISELQTQGRHILRHSANENMQAGIYFVEMNIDGERLVRKIAVL